MNIYLTFDYELFFGEQSGSVEKCMLEPTDELLSVFEKHHVYATFFVDVGYLVAADRYSELDNEKQKVEDQIKAIVAKGHDVQLHIHPHWEKAEYINGQWEMNVSGAYRLQDFNESEKKDIVRRYKSRIEQVIGREVLVFRAGGWCIQPFDELMDVFTEVGIKADTSVIPGDFMQTNEYALDFRDAPQKDRYRFSDDVCIETEDGPFIELPITSMRYSPLFFWRLYALGRLFPEKHRMRGDGRFLDQGGRKKKVLTSYGYHHVSTDGYFASKLTQGLQMAINRGYREMVIIGHPKGNTLYSIKKLEDFIAINHSKHSFTTFHQTF